MKVTFVHAVCAKRGPTMALPRSRTRAEAPIAVNPGWAFCGIHPFAHESHQALVRAALSAFQPNDKPMTMRARSAAVFAKVNVFWTNLPVSRPRVFDQVSKPIS